MIPFFFYCTLAVVPLFMYPRCHTLDTVPLLYQADNAGFDATDLLNRLRQKHARDGDAGKWFGVDVDTEGELLTK